MTRCLDYYDKFEKEGNFCGLCTAAISQIKAYNEIRKKIEVHIKDRALIVDNFPEGACREMLQVAKDEETRTKAINYVVECLKRREKVTGGDLKKTIHGWLQPRSCNVGKKDGDLGNVSKKLTNVNSPREQKPPLPVENDQKKPVEIQTLAQQQAAKEVHIQPAPAAAAQPAAATANLHRGVAPCQRGETCNHLTTEKRGKVCKMTGRPINQLPPSGCPFPDDKKAGFTRASGSPSSPAPAEQPLPRATHYPLLSKEEWYGVTSDFLDCCLSERYHRIIQDIREARPKEYPSPLDVIAKGLDLAAEKLLQGDT